MDNNISKNNKEPRSRIRETNIVIAETREVSHRGKGSIRNKSGKSEVRGKKWIAEIPKSHTWNTDATYVVSCIVNIVEDVDKFSKEYGKKLKEGLFLSARIPSWRKKNHSKVWYDT